MTTFIAEKIFIVGYHARGTGDYMEVIIKAPDADAVRNTINAAIPGFNTVVFPTKALTIEEAIGVLEKTAEIK